MARCFRSYVLTLLRLEQAGDLKGGMRGLRRFSSNSQEMGSVLFEQTGRVSRITLNRPALHNAFNEHVIGDITNAFREASRLAEQGDTRVVIFTGNGKSFSAGADLSWMKKMAGYSHEENAQDSLHLYDMVLSLRACPVPVIARVNGSAIGGGAGLVAASDIAVGVEGSLFGFTEVKLGLIPAVISPFVIARIGRTAAQRYFLTGERFDVDAALAIGLLHERVADNKALDARVESLAEEICNNSPHAVKLCKKLIQNVSGSDYFDPETRRSLANEIASIRVSEEGQEGLTAFLGKRQPSWRD